MEKKKYRMQWCSFFKKFIFWFLGIPINAIPVLFKQLEKITAENFPGLPTLTLMTVGDFDFSFISVSVVFILCIEGFFADNDLAPIYRLFQLGCAGYSFLLVILYCVFFFRPDLFSLMNFTTSVIYNSCLIGLTIVLGILCNATISMKASVSV